MAKHYYSEYGLGSQSGADPLNATQGLPSQLIQGDEYTEVKYEQIEIESVLSIGKPLSGAAIFLGEKAGQ